MHLPRDHWWPQGGRIGYQHSSPKSVMLSCIALGIHLSAENCVRHHAWGITGARYGSTIIIATHVAMKLKEFMPAIQ